LTFTVLDIPEVILIEPDLFRDARGFFLEVYHRLRYAEHGIPDEFVQDNHSASVEGVLRGLHYQIRQPQGKLVHVLQGEIFDVAVDLRCRAATFGRWVGRTLTAGRHGQMWIPPGFAHGYLVLSDRAEVAYKVTDYYAPEWERVLRWDDPTVGIRWPLEAGQVPILSERDARGSLLAAAETFP